MGYLAVLSASRGRIAGVVAAIGVAFGLAILGAIAGLGLDTFILDNRWAYETVRWAGAAYLFWLAYEAWLEGRRPLEVAGGDENLFRYFMRGLITNMLNPKAGLFFVTVLPKFVNPAMPVTHQLVVLVIVYVAIATFVHLAVALLAGSLQRFFASAEWRQRAATVFAILLVAIAIWMFINTRLA
ncbi:MAG: LysE family translocator [Rhizobiaceae bacterium]